MARREWTEARAKVEKEGRCRSCRAGNKPLEAAHLIGRGADRMNEKGVIEVNPNSIVPLCGPFGDITACHTRYDTHRLDILPVINIEEEVQAVRDAAHLYGRKKGLALAYRRLTGERIPAAEDNTHRIEAHKKGAAKL